MVKQSPELSAILKKRRNDIYFPATASKFEALAFRTRTPSTASILTPSLSTSSPIRDRNLYEVMKQIDHRAADSRS